MEPSQPLDSRSSKRNLSEFQGRETLILSSSGFLSIAFLSLLPLVASLLFIIGFMSLTLKGWTQIQNTCRKEVLETGSQLKTLFLTLQSLNPQATQLRWQHQLALRHYQLSLLSGQPLAIAQAHTRWLLVRAQQKAFHTQQLKLLNSARWTLQNARSRWFTGGLSPARVTHIQSPPNGLAVSGQPFDSLSPNYEPLPNFSKQQTLQIDWRWDIKKDWPPWLQKAGAQSTRWFQSNCQSTLEWRSSQWVNTLKKGKF